MISKQEHWQIVRRLHENWMCYEAADRGYDFNAAQKALYHYTVARAFYEAWWNVHWDESAVPLHKVVD